MRSLRMILVQRSLAVLVIASLLPVAFVSAEREAQRSGPYADWVRGQLATSNTAVEQALAAAASQPAGSLEAFLATFIEAYEAQGAGASLARVFVDHDLSNEGLIAYLQSRYGGMVSDGVLPRTALIQLTSSVHLSDRQSLAVVPPADRMCVLQPCVASLGKTGARLFVKPLRLVWAAQPLGP